MLGSLPNKVHCLTYNLDPLVLEGLFPTKRDAYPPIAMDTSNCHIIPTVDISLREFAELYPDFCQVHFLPEGRWIDERILDPWIVLENSSKQPPEDKDVTGFGLMKDVKYTMPVEWALVVFLLLRVANAKMYEDVCIGFPVKEDQKWVVAKVVDDSVHFSLSEHYEDSEPIMKMLNQTWVPF